MSFLLKLGFFLFRKFCVQSVMMSSTGKSLGNRVFSYLLLGGLGTLSLAIWQYPFQLEGHAPSDTAVPFLIIKPSKAYICIRLFIPVEITEMDTVPGRAK